MKTQLYFYTLATTINKCNIILKHLFCTQKNKVSRNKYNKRYINHYEDHYKDLVKDMKVNQ